MPAPSLLVEPLTPDFIADTLKEADAELTLLFEKAKLPLEIQARFISLGFTETDTFSKMASSEEMMRAIVDDELGLRLDLGLKKRSIEAKVLSAWEAAGKRSNMRKGRGATTTAYNQPAVLEQQEYVLMLQAFEAAHHPFRYHQTPAQEYAGAKLKEAEVAALRFYSSKSFAHITAPIRDLTRRDRGEMVPLPATTIHVVNGLKKLRRVGSKKSDAVIEKVFFRGLKNLRMTDEFAKVGGTELAPMSTTSELTIAVRYGMSRNSLIFRIVTRNNLERGSDISHISVFPNESEVLFAPLTFLQPTGRSQILQLGGITVTVVEVTPTAS